MYDRDHVRMMLQALAGACLCALAGLAVLVAVSAWWLGRG